LQCVAVCCSVLGWYMSLIAGASCTHHIVLQCVAVCCSVLQCIAVRCGVLQCVGLIHVCHHSARALGPLTSSPPPPLSFLSHWGTCACCSMLRCVAVCRSVLQCVAVCCDDDSGSRCSASGGEYGVATISRLLKIIGLFCKRAL